jgi:DNA-binding MarR family transcriptional regulator
LDYNEAEMDGTSTASIPYLTRVSRAVYEAASEERLGIGLKQLALLIRLRDRGALPQQALADYAHASQNTLVVWLNGLEERGLVTRLRDPDDRRKHIVDISDRGREAVRRAENELFLLEEQVLAPLSTEERAQLRALLARALDAAR